MEMSDSHKSIIHFMK